MIKKIIEISGDFILFIGLLGIILLTFISVLTLSPINAEKFGYTKEKDLVLGANNSQRKLIFISNFEQNPFFNVAETNENLFTQIIEAGPMNGEKYIKDIFSITNPDSNNRTFKITFVVSEDSKKYANWGIHYDGKEYLLVETNGEERVLNGNIQPNSKADFKLIIDPSSKINFKLNVKVIVEEELINFDLPN